MSTKIAELNSFGALHGRPAAYPAPRRPVAFRAAADRLFSGFSLWRRLQTSMLTRAAAGLLAIVALTGFFLHVLPVNITTVGFAYLLAILVASMSLDLRGAIAMCILATLAYDYYFLPPEGTFNISDPQDWVALFAFLVTAIIGSHLVTRARKRAEEANVRRMEAEKLYGLSQSLLAAGDPLQLLDAIPHQVAESFAFQSVALYLSEKQKVFSSGIDLPQSEIQGLRKAAELKGPQIVSDCNTYLVPIQLRDRATGSLALFGSPVSRESLDAVGALVAVAIDRARAIEQVARIEAQRENERLKSVLLDAITHDFRTPLTSIKVSATGLLDNLEFDREQRKELLTIIDEECDRINRLVGEAAEMARLESGEVKLELASHSIGELISYALSDCKGATPNREIVLALAREDSQLTVDLCLATKVLVHLITNAHLYSAPDQPITIATEECAKFLAVRIADKGPGIDETDVRHIFEKFYRGKKHRYRVHGTGMGLAIAKAIVEAHGGTIGVVSHPGQGSVFTFTLPLER
jgi:two-component system sensor histidine kinase KdpD